MSRETRYPAFAAAVTVALRGRPIQWAARTSGLGYAAVHSWARGWKLPLDPVAVDTLAAALGAAPGPLLNAWSICAAAKRQRRLDAGASAGVAT